MHPSALVSAALVVSGLILRGQTPPPTPLRLLTPQDARPLPTLIVNDVEMIALEELARVFPITVREDQAAHAITVSWRGRTTVLTPDQSLASVNGRLVSLPASPVRIGGKWFVPIDFVSRALSPIADSPIELRKPSRLVIAGGARVPRITTRYDTPSGIQLRVTFEISPPTPHSVAQETGRLVVRFEADALDPALTPPPAQQLVQAVHVSDTGTSIVLELGPRFGSFRAFDAPGESTTARFVVDILPAAEPAPPPTAGGQAPAPATPQTPVLSPSGATAGVHVVVIDPGHGGDDTGVRGRKGTREKDVTLAVARRLKAMLESRISARVLLTRDDDRNVAADDRAAVANNNKGDVFLSLHTGGSMVPALAGASVYYLGLDERSAASPEAAGSGGLPMPVFGGGTREIDIIPWRMAQARHIDDSASLARRVESDLRGSAVPMNPRTLLQAPLRVLVGANMPAVLVEMGYLTNAEQEGALAGADLQARVARGLADAVVRFDAAQRSLAAQTTP